MKLSKHDTIITAVAEYCSGSSWSNQILNVIIQDGDKKLRIEYLQPEEWAYSPQLSALFPVSAAINGQVVQALRNGK
jgi:hypothetical protein